MLGGPNNDTSLWGNLGLDQSWNQTAVTTGQDDLDALEMVVIVIMSFIAVVGFLGNLSVAAVIINNPSLRSSMTNLFVLNLVLVDLLACVLAMPLAIVAYSVRNSNQDIQLCEVSGFLSTSFMLCSMLTLCVISMDRFYSIAMPLHHAAHTTPLIALFVVVCVWIIGIGVASLPCLGLNSYKFKHKERMCSFEWAGDKNDRTFVITIFIISFLIPSLVILAMYSSIFCIARRAARTIAPQPSESTHSTIIHTELDMSKNEHPELPVTSTAREMAVSTIGTSMERRLRVRMVSFPSEDGPSDFTDMNGCRSGFVIGYSSSSNDETENDVTSNGIVANGRHSDTPSSMFKQYAGRSILKQQLTNSRSINGNCNQENCEQHHCSEGNARRISFNRSANINSQNKQNNSNHHPSPTTMYTNSRLQENVTAVPMKCSTSISQEMFYQNGQTTSSNARTPNPCRSQPTPSAISSQQPITIQPAPVTPRPKHNKAFRTVMVIVLSYLLLWGPYFFCQVHKSRGESVNPNSQLLVSWLGFVSYTVHPFLYGGMNRLIRDELCQLYRTMLTWLHASFLCLCWSCCRCCKCVNIHKIFFTPRSEDNGRDSSAVVYCMPWLRGEEENEAEVVRGEEEQGEGKMSVAPGPESRKKKNGRSDNGEDRDAVPGDESFFEFLQRTQDENSHVPDSVVRENHSTT